MNIRLSPDSKLPACDLIAVIACEGRDPPAGDLGRLVRAAQATGDLKADFRKVGLFHTADKRRPRLLVVGAGKVADLTLERLRRLAALAQAQAEAHGVAELALVCDLTGLGLDAHAAGRAVAEGLVLGAYRYAPPSRKSAKKRAAQAAQVVLLGGERSVFAAGFEFGRLAAAATVFARDLANGPANLVTPTRLAVEAKRLAGRGVSVRVLERRDMERLGMGALLGVAQGSAQPPKLIALDYRPPRAKSTVCVIGKGLTFDTGGISIKPAAKMEEMRYDMCGGAAVLGLFHAIRHGALRQVKRPVRVVGIVGAVENMPGGGAQRPGDVVTACDGTTIEVLNTDAEGRLVLADAIAWARRTYQPKCVVDLATLTGAVVVALGHEVAAVLGNQDGLVQELLAAGKAADEPLWQLPLWEVHKGLNKSKYADLANLPNAAGGAGTIGAAAFLAHFAEDTPWAHLDIAGTAWGAESKDYYTTGATGTGVRTLLQWLLG
jgi:leucyl aminopeptidase